MRSSLVINNSLLRKIILVISIFLYSGLSTSLWADSFQEFATPDFAGIVYQVSQGRDAASRPLLDVRCCS